MSEGLQYITDASGQKRGVLLPLEEYERLMEDLADLALVAERRDEATIPHEQFVKELRRDGLLPH
jgi:PHD/YefM family antitoxin component YafN of YafNO toxin-antitoxin module